MKSIKTGLLVIAAIFCIQPGKAQEVTAYKFGQVTPADFSTSGTGLDSNADAVIISDIGIADFEGNDEGLFTIVFTHYMRVKIINKNGISIGSHKIYLRKQSAIEFEDLFSIRGSTFNLENGAVQETKMDSKSIFREVYNKDYSIKKFSLPGLKAGSIFDLEYTIKSPFLRLQPWSFQGKYPRLWSEFVVTIPPPLHYVLKKQGDQTFDIDTKEDVHKNYIVHLNNETNSNQAYHVSGMSVRKRWVKKNVPALREEPFTTTKDNYNSKLAFQLEYIQWTKEDKKYSQLADWFSTSHELLEREEFGHALNHENNWMSDQLRSLTDGAKTEDEKVQKIFAYVRDNFRAVNKDGYSKNNLYVESSLKDVFFKKEGNVAEINLLLIAMLRKAFIDADPLILSTRDNGYADLAYPLIDEYNYVVCVAYPDKKMVLLDASDPFNGYNQLPERCYNGWGHIINMEKPAAIEFSADSIWERKFTSVRVMNNDQGNFSGNFSKTFGRDSSSLIRREIYGSGLSSFEKRTRSASGTNLTIANFKLDSLDNNDLPLGVRFDFNINNIQTSDLVYLNPMFGEGYWENPFKSMSRLCPVEMPYKIDETYVLSMEIPTGFGVDEMPKSARVKLSETKGSFEYLIQQAGGMIQMRVHLKFNAATFNTEEYNDLRDFFSYVVKKESEQIVFKRIK